MKHIGIVDITTIGACICANEIVAQAAKIYPFDEHPEFTMHAFSFRRYKEHLIKQDWRGMGEVILESIVKLHGVGADFIVIPSNTPHFAIDLIQEKAPLKVMSILEITAEECVKRGFKKVAVLGTKYTMLGGLYDSILRQKGITAVVPDGTVCARIDHLIMNEIVPSKVMPESVERVRQDIRQISCDGVILGCTELPEVYNEKNLGILAIDTTRLLAHKALEFALI